MYFQDKPYGYSASLPTAELLLTDISDYGDYTTFTNPYYYQIPLDLTPFDTEFTNSFKEIKIDFEASQAFRNSNKEVNMAKKIKNPISVVVTENDGIHTVRADYGVESDGVHQRRSIDFELLPATINDVMEETIAAINDHEGTTG
ncbi:hypothetical protein LCGC14_2967060, partial [marine sediment metagenome]